MQGLNKHLAAEIKRGHFEADDKGGLYLPKSRVFVGGVFEITHRRKSGEILSVMKSPNMVPQEGRQYILDIIADGRTQEANWYIGLFEGDYTPDDLVTAATVAADATECTAYDQSERPLWDTASPIVSDTASNSASRAVYTFNDDKTVYGGFLISSDEKGGSSGLLLAISRFPAEKIVATTEELTAAYLFSVADA